MMQINQEKNKALPGLVSVQMPSSMRILEGLCLLLNLWSSYAFSVSSAFPPNVLRRCASSIPATNPGSRSVALVLGASSVPQTEAEKPIESARQKIEAALSPIELDVAATYDDPNGSHISIRVVSNQFEGVSRVKRQQMVYKAIWEEMQGAIHAVDSMICKAPNET